MSSTQHMRVSLPTGTILSGKKDKYTVKSIAGRSERTLTALCEDSKGRQCRLKIFDGKCSVDGPEVNRMLAVRTRGVLKPFDFGIYNNCKFWVSGNYSPESTDRQTISLNSLSSVIIPQLSYVINAFHGGKVLLRDIAPEHVLFDLPSKMICYTGFSNMALLNGGATITKEAGYGQSYEYIAPEVDAEGYSSASDYFSLGVTIFSILKGKKAFEGISREELYRELLEGRVPGIDTEHLRKTPYEMYSAEDKVLYLIMGLLLPDPANRWGYGEIRCWCNDQHIPLVQKGRRERYQFNRCFVINNVKCWNRRMLSECLSNNIIGLGKADITRLLGFLKEQMGSSNDLDMIAADGLPASQVFKLIYFLNPATNGFCWKGHRYASTDDFVKEVRNDRISLNDLQDILAHDCISYYDKCRSGIGIPVSENMDEIRELEQLEKTQSGLGANRFLMLFARKNARSFMIDGRDYSNVMSLLQDYSGKGVKLKERSLHIICNDSFQAWLWAKGLEESGNIAQKNVSENIGNNFAFLMTLFEKCVDTEEDKKKIRKFFLKYGDLSPVLWLINNIQHYKVISPDYQSSYEAFKDAKLDLNKSVTELNDWLSSMVSEYLLFVQKTVKNPFLLENEHADESGFGYYPQYESGYFCLKWNGLLEASPAFMRAVNGTISRDAEEAWLQEGMSKEKQVLEQRKNKIIVGDISGSSEYLETCNKNMTASIAMIVIAAIMMLLGLKYSVGVGILSFAGAVLFPIMALGIYYRKRTRAEMWYSSNSQQAHQRATVQKRIDALSKRKKEIMSGIENGKNIECKLYTDDIDTTNAVYGEAEELDLTKGQVILAYISTYAFVLLTTVMVGTIYSSFLAASLYSVIYGIGAPYLFRRQKFINSSVEWSVTTLIVGGVSVLGNLMFGNTFLATMNWIPIIGAIVILVLIIILSNL